MGSGATVGYLLLLFMSVTSTISSSMIAVSSILSFDVFRTYIKPNATDKQIVRASHLGVIFHGIFITGITLALNYGGANLQWLAYCMPILTCPGIFPMIFAILWSEQTRLAAVLSPLLGVVLGLAIWLATSKKLYHEINMTTTGMIVPPMCGGLVSLFSPILWSILISKLGPRETFDWSEFLKIELVNDKGDGTSEASTLTPVVNSSAPFTRDAEKSQDIKSAAEITTVSAVVHPFDEETLHYLNHWYKIAWAILVAIILITFLFWPIPLYRDWIFTKSFFRGWVTFSIVWQFFAVGAVIVYPIVDGWREIMRSVRGILKNRQM